MNAITLTPINSTNIESVGYDDSGGRMIIKFRTGFLYEYGNVSREVYANLLSAPSAGKYFASHIRRRYPFKEVKINDKF